MRTVLRLIAFVLAALLLPIAVGAAHASATFGAVFAPRADTTSVAPPARPYDPAKPTAAVVLGTHGTVASDALAPYEILAATGAFNLYTVAAQATPVPLSGGLDVVPDLTFAQLDAQLGPRHPDLVVVPALRDLGTDAEAPLTGWLRHTAAEGALMQSVCNGAEVLAALLDGRHATAHWAAVADYAERFPAVDWVSGPRFVEDGTDRLTTGGILAGIDGTLRVVERLVGPAAAAQAASSVHYGRYVPGPARPLPPVERSGADAVALLNAGFGFDAPTIGVALTPGVGEMELASVFEVYGGQSLTTHTIALSAGARPVTTRHGLVILPRGDVATAAVDRLLVPGADAAARRAPLTHRPARVRARPPRLRVRRPARRRGRHLDVATARFAAKSMNYPADGLDLEGRAWPWPTLAWVVALALAGLGLAAGVDRALRRRRRAPVTQAA